MMPSGPKRFGMRFARPASARAPDSARLVSAGAAMIPRPVMLPLPSCLSPGSMSTASARLGVGDRRGESITIRAGGATDAGGFAGGCGRRSCRGSTPWSGPALVAEFLVEDLADEPIERDRVEPGIGPVDDAGVHDLAPRQVVEHALEMIGGRALVAADLQILALQHQPGRVSEAEPAGDSGA